MKLKTVTNVKVYITESSHLENKILDYLKNEAKVPGVTVYRAVRGYGSTGEHTVALVDLSLDLPLVIEFFEVPEKALQAIEHLNSMVNPGHIVFYDAQVNAK